MDISINKEKYHNKLAAIFNDEHAARQQLIEEAQFSTRQISIVRPHDNQAGHKIEPETKAIGNVLLTSHLVCGGIGFISGLIIASLTSLIGPTFAQSSPL